MMKLALVLAMVLVSLGGCVTTVQDAQRLGHVKDLPEAL